MDEGIRDGSHSDAVERAFRMILADGRRALSEEEERSGKALWRRVFQKVPGERLLKAVQTWLEESPKGRPNVGELSKLLKELPESDQAHTQVCVKRDETELKWAVSILEAWEKNSEWRERMSRPEYQHTIESAHFALKKRGFSSWQDARSYLEPGWAPPTITETIL